MTICDVNTCKKPLPKTSERYTGMFLDKKYIFCKQCYQCLVAFVKRRFSSDEMPSAILDPSIFEQLLVNPAPSQTHTYPAIQLPQIMPTAPAHSGGFYIISSTVADTLVSSSVLKQ